MRHLRILQSVSKAWGGAGMERGQGPGSCLCLGASWEGPSHPRLNTRKPGVFSHLVLADDP